MVQELLKNPPDGKLTHKARKDSLANMYKFLLQTGAVIGNEGHELLESIWNLIDLDRSLQHDIVTEVNNEFKQSAKDFNKLSVFGWVQIDEFKVSEDDLLHYLHNMTPPRHVRIQFCGYDVGAFLAMILPFGLNGKVRAQFQLVAL